MVKYDKGHRSKNVEYRAPSGRARRGLPMGGRRGGGLPLPLPTGRGGKAGVGGIGGIIVLLVVMFASGAFSGGGTSGLSGGASCDGGTPPRNSFLEFVFDDVQEMWDGIFRDAGQQYDLTTMVIFENCVDTACGPATAAVGPFYCPADSQVYLDQDFFDELATRFGAPGDFGQAYVVAHEVAHHVQNVLGTSGEVRTLQAANPGDKNELSVALELQADCYAGVWGASAQADGLLERGDLEEGLGAAAAVGDDRIQESAGARVNPETWTHGSSEQRISWFRRGFDSGDPEVCDTFGGLR